jgi:predicted Rossmann-fold nucleotide-binding protein
MDHRRLRHAFEHMKYVEMGGQTLFKPSVAYENKSFLSSSVARALRVHTEVLEPLDRLDAAGVHKTILFFGSARSLPKAEHAAALASARGALAAAVGEGAHKAAAAKLDRLEKMAWMCDVYANVEALARRLTGWSLGRIGALGVGGAPYIVATGGGPGLMEAANKGAASVPGAVTAGVAIELPFENAMNAYVTPELAFQCNYFFTRKFQLMHPCRALIVTAGGFGTCDELFEFLTLMQCGKTEDADCLPVVMFPGTYVRARPPPRINAALRARAQFGLTNPPTLPPFSKQWRRIINWDVFIETGVISPEDMNLLYFTDDVEDAFSHVTSRLLEWERRDAAKREKKEAEAPTLKRSDAARAYDELLRAHRARATAAADTAFAAAENAGSQSPLPGAGGGAGGGAGAV